MGNKIAGMKVTIPDHAREAIVDKIDGLLLKGWLMWGDEQADLKQNFLDMTAQDWAETFNSATSALDVLFEYLYNVKGMRRAAFQATAFPSPVFSARRAGFEIMWLDVDPDTMMPIVDRDDFDVYVPQWTGGFVPENAKQQIADLGAHGVVTVEDCSHASGAADEHGRYAGSMGYYAVWSLAATKPLQTGQGGMLASRDLDLEQYAFEAKNYGRDAMFQKGNYVMEGRNLHMTEVQAAIGNVLFEYMQDQIDRRAEIAERIRDESGLKVLGDWSGSPNFYKLAVRMPEQYWGDRAGFAAKLAEHDVEMGSAVYDFVTPHLPVFAGEYQGVMMPGANFHVDTHACVPCHNGMTDADVDQVVKACASL